jgi:hypothetical protein
MTWMTTRIRRARIMWRSLRIVWAQVPARTRWKITARAAGYLAGLAALAALVVVLAAWLVFLVSRAG